MMIRLLSIFLCTALFAMVSADDFERLQKIQKSLQSSDEIERFRAYNESKTIYLKATASKNTEVAKEALESIVKGGNSLGIDVSKYESDLAKVSPIKTAAVEEKAPTLPKPASVPKAEEPLVSKLPFPTETLKKEIKVAPKVIKIDDVSVEMRHRLLEAKWKEKGLELQFDSPLKESEIKFSKIIESSKGRFRYIIDVESATLSRSQTLEHKDINRVKIAQYDAKTLRLVIENTKAISLKYDVKGSSLYIDLSLEPMKGIQDQTSAVTEAPVVQEPPLVAALPPLGGPSSFDRKKKTVVIDPGHGGKDSGAVGNSKMEKEIVLQIGSELANRLKAMGYNVFMTRSNDTFVELKDRTKFANDKNADLFISVHANSIPKTSDPNGAQGIETYFLSPTRSERAMRVAALENSEDMEEMGQYGKLSFLSVLNKEKIIASNKLGIDLQKSMLSNLRKQFPNVQDNGVREAPFWVLVGAQMPAVLVEVGYISHPDESSRIADPKYQRWMVEGLIEGVGRYFANNP